jgi:hypothetical protein
MAIVDINILPFQNFSDDEKINRYFDQRGVEWKVEKRGDKAFFYRKSAYRSYLLSKVLHLKNEEDFKSIRKCHQRILTSQNTCTTI